MFDDKLFFLHYFRGNFDDYMEKKLQNTYSKEDTKAFKVGFIVSVILILVGIYFIHSQQKYDTVDDGRYYQIHARFGRTDGLLVGGLVRLSGVDVGRVIEAELDDNFNAVLTLEIKEDIKIPDDSSASIVSSGLMGPKYIEIDVGSSEDYIEAGGEFEYTQDAMVLEELLDRIVSMGKAKRKKDAVVAKAEENHKEGEDYYE